MRKLEAKHNLDVNLSKLAILVIGILFVADTAGYVGSPFNYNATYPPYNSAGLDAANRWIARQSGYFRVMDPLGGTHNHVLSWDNASFIEGPPGNPEYLPYSLNTIKTLNLTRTLPSENIEVKGYFGVKYAIGHLTDPRIDQAGLANTSWLPVERFEEDGFVYVFLNPFFRPIAEFVSDPDDMNASLIGEVSFSSYSANIVEMNVHAYMSGYLVFKFFSFPRWTCLVDNEEVRIDENCWGFMFVHLPKGSHDVRFLYARSGFDGLNVTIVGLGMTSLCALLRIIWTRRKRQ